MIIKEKVKAKVGMSKKAIHGHVCIDLHNHKSGFTERIEADNLVTNYMDVVSGMAAMSDSWAELFPIASKGLGGIFLFDGNLAENANNIVFPADVHLVGYAGQVANGSEKFAGSYNAVESQALSNGFKTVWDFSTAQANGTIASLARTNYKAGINGPFPVGFGVALGSPRGKAIIHEDNILYFGNGTTLYNARFPFMNFNVTDALKNIQWEVESEGDQEVNFGNLFNGGNGYAYICTGIATNTFTYQTVKLSDLSFEVGDSVTVTVENSSFNDGSRCIFYGGYAYISKGDKSGIYKVNLSNVADQTFISMPEGYQFDPWDGMYVLGNGVVMVRIKNASDNSSSIGLLYPDNVLEHFTTLSERFVNDGYANRAFSQLESLFYTVLYSTASSASYMAAYAETNYLGTIANISPVTKTAAQSMKITYTLTNV